MDQFTGTGRIARSINTLAQRTTINRSQVAPNILTTRTTRGTFQRPARKPVNAATLRPRSATPRWL